MATARQKFWAAAAEKAAKDGNLAAGLFSLIAQPNEIERRERGHVCQGIDIRGFTRDGRRGLKCMICGTVIRWID